MPKLTILGAVFCPTWATVYTVQAEIWHVRVCHGFTLAHQFRSWVYLPVLQRPTVGRCLRFQVSS